MIISYQENLQLKKRFTEEQIIGMLCVLDENTRECLGIEVARWLRSHDVILMLSRLMKIYGKPQYIRSDNTAAAGY